MLSQLCNRDRHDQCCVNGLDYFSIGRISIKFLSTYLMQHSIILKIVKTPFQSPSNRACSIARNLSPNILIFSSNIIKPTRQRGLIFQRLSLYRRRCCTFNPITAPGSSIFVHRIRIRKQDTTVPELTNMCWVHPFSPARMQINRK